MKGNLGRSPVPPEEPSLTLDREGGGRERLTPLPSGYWQPGFWTYGPVNLPGLDQGLNLDEALSPGQEGALGWARPPGSREVAPLGPAWSLEHGFCLDKTQGGGRAAGVLALTCCPPPPAGASPSPSSKVRASSSRHTEAGTRMRASLAVKVQREGNLTSRQSPEPELPELGVRVQLYLAERIVISSVHPSSQPSNKHLLSTCYVPGSGLGAGDTDMNQIDVGPEFW